MSGELELRVFGSRSELHRADGSVEVFQEGPPGAAAKQRTAAIYAGFERGFLVEQIRLCKEQPESLDIEQVPEADQALIGELVRAISSEVGRALGGLLVMQLAVKAICPDQNVRLHKAGHGFSWVEGIPMRSIDKRHVTPALREHELLRMNADGVMMTRSLAENYPYTLAYKPEMRGAKSQWLRLVERVEDEDPLPPLPALQYLLSQLLNEADALEELGGEAVAELQSPAVLAADPRELITAHVDGSAYSARLLEVAMHALFQALEAGGALAPLQLERLSQMRSANKKHGNVGDIELLGQGQIAEAWDAKYGKVDLREALAELDEKLLTHPGVASAGFVHTGSLAEAKETREKAKQVEARHGTKVALLSFDGWVEEQLARSSNPTQVAREWLRAYTESLAQRRREIAPIDEPTFEWLREWLEILRGR
ncbi:MAG TPA: hypothetical protein VGO36_08720 [Solirubrobacterales bacterium]|jgi:hypothetical protein|nr:hypothetical protein [Solirubrobacterales bacterium]